MKSFVYPWLLGAMLLWLSASLQAQALEPVNLLVTGPIVAPKVTFDVQTRLWLETRPTIKVALWSGALPPLDMGFEQSKFEGVAAEYLEVVRQATGLKLHIERYPSRADARQAVKNGEADMLAIHDVTEGQVGPITQSRPYLLNRKVIVRRIGESRQPTPLLQGQRLGYVGDEAVGAELQKQYPKAVLLQYGNHLNGLASLVYDQADAFWTDAISAEFLIRLLYSNDLYIAGDASENAADFNFAVSDRQPQLLAAIDQTLDAIPVDDMKRITTRWGLSNNFVVHQPPLNLDAVELEWLAAHPKIKVLVAGSYAPMTFLDEHNQLQGLSIDILKIIRERTGLAMEFVPTAGVQDMLDQLKSHKADLIAAVSIGDLRVPLAQYTRPYMISPFVIVTRRTQDIHNPAQMEGKHLAIPAGNPLTTWLAREYPKIEQVPVPNAIRGIEMLSEDEVDGTVHTQFGADYFIKHHFQHDLHIAAVVGPVPARISMAVGPDDLILKDIINKVLVDIAPEELKSLSDRWRNHAAPAVANSWSTYKDDVYKVILVAVAFVFVFVVWIYYLQSQIKKRRKAEQALGDQLAFSKTLIDGSPIALYVRDREGRLAQCNRAYLDFLQTTREHVIGKTLLDSSALSPLMSERYHQLYLRTQTSGQPTYADLEIDVKGNPHRIYHWTLPFQTSTGVFSGVIGGWLDISEREQLVEQLRLAKQIADEANESKSIFLASMSHEIRTPISALIGLIEMLRVRRGTPAQIEENLLVAHQSAQSLLSLIGDILDLSKIEAGAMIALPRRTNLNEVLQSVHKLFEINASNKGLTFELIVEVSEPHVMIDALMLNQIVANLVSNAIKFTDHGFVQLSLRQLPSDLKPEHGRYEIQVRDSGSGVNEVQKKAIFEPFVQLAPKINSARSTGLGLSICTRLATLLDAQLTVDSQPGAGSCFSLVFAADQTQPDVLANPPRIHAPAHFQLNVLVVEDHAPNRLLLCQQLEYLGHRAVPAEDGEAALALWQREQPAFDLTITDCNMPRMDGFEMTRRMRTIEQALAVGAHPIFGLTATAQTEAVQACLDAGMTQCLFKPLGIDELTQQVGAISTQIERRHTAALTNGSELQKLRVLNPDAYGPLVDQLVSTNREDVAKLEQSLQNGDLANVARIAHKVKGGAQLADAQVLIEACTQLETLAEQGERLALQQALNVVVAAIGDLEILLLADR
ncbi:transporter substrate-binding domain-containing protein [Pseudomonas yamanorum]|uniref:histidine kinase n=1 Tax=Pseudomonas yamanorum TaxID=515393 RepID=A0AAJ3LGT0_9PSED|nr:transporter substrate-binding domain-containing protein [Pseudomonas yamanorum]NWD42488.1 transporter substrate-binding domain-containing protein [Pseudomonas yamanorum]